ncbi:hypothetical protein [Streptomyces sp. NPDC002265]|uniref:hypothetical protein n=1 Tax=Streptomyces sp. NPDC002265 TaxID=3154415 RepID=UPI00331907E3
MSRAHRAAVFRSAAFLLTTGLTIGALAAVPAVADPVTVTGVSTGDDGRLSVALPDSQALWVKISIHDPARPDVPVLASTDELSFSWEHGWRTDQPLRLPGDAAYGDYPVDVDFRLADGTVQHWSGAEHGRAGLFGYRLHTGVATAAFDRAYTDYDHRDATLSGTVTTFDPATGTTGAARAGTQVRIAWSTLRNGTWIDISQTVLTDESGAFTLPVTPGGTLLSGTATVVAPQADTDPDDAEAIPELDAVATRYRITAEADKARVYAGKTFKVSGDVQRLTPNGWVPFANAPVITTTHAPDPWNHTVTDIMGSAAAGADGTFSYDARADHTTTHYTYVQPSDYLADYTDPFSDEVTVPRAGQIGNLSATLDAYRTITVTGRLKPEWICNAQTVTLQYSKNGRDGWQNLASAKAEGGTAGYCPFTIRALGRPSGYYRVAHGESYTLLPVNSAAFSRSRIETRIVSFDMTPNRPYRNASLTAKGTLQYKSGSTWKNYKGGQIVLVLRPKGESTWYWVVKGTTDSAGRFSLKTKAYEDATWGAYLAADSKHFYSESKSEYVDAR